MKTILLSLILCILAMTKWSTPAFAGEEKSEEKPAAEATKEGGKEGKEGASEADTMPWLAIEAKIQEMSARIESKKESINKMLEEKEKLKDNSPELKEKIQEIITEHKALEKLAEEYSEQVSLLKYRYPERHAKRDRKYDHVEVKSVDDMEQALGVDGKLTRNMTRMRTIYDEKPVEKEKVNAESTEKMPAKKTPKGKTIEEQSPIIMQK